MLSFLLSFTFIIGFVIGIGFIIYTINDEGAGLAIACYLLLLAGYISPTTDINLQSYITSVSIFGTLLIIGYLIHKLDLLLTKAIIKLWKKT